MHEPEVSCIAKSKAHKEYEFDSKVGIVSTIKNSFILAVDTFHSALGKKEAKAIK